VETLLRASFTSAKQVGQLATQTVVAAVNAIVIFRGDDG